ncbi:MAG: hypothetical protein V3T77_05605 [Planctomycetota bacterium]
MKTFLKKAVWMLVVLGAAQFSVAQQPSTVRPQTAKSKVIASCLLYHVLAQKAEKPLLPAKLKEFQKSLLRTGYQSFQLASSKNLKLVQGKVEKVKLPSKLGIAQISLNEKGFITVRLLNNKGKVQGSYKVGGNLKPKYLVNEKFKTGASQYILIVKKK